MEYVLKQAVDNQKQEIFDLYCLVMKAFIEDIWGWDPQWQENDFASYFVAKNITLACEGEKIVGYIQSEDYEQHRFVRMLLIHPQYQHQGIGRKLLTRVVGEAQKYSQPVKLEVFKINSKVLKFYEQFGFSVNGETQHSFIMEKCV